MWPEQKMAKCYWRGDVQFSKTEQYRTEDCAEIFVQCWMQI